MKLVSFRNYSLAYSKDSPHALDSITLDLNSGESVVVSGLSGSGKSTLCLAAAGLLETFPAIVTGGEVIRGDESENLKTRVSTVLQNFYSQITYLRPTVMEEIAFPCENLGLPREETARRVAEAIERIRIGHIADRNPLGLSGGEKQKVVLAAAIATKPDLLILDEPLSQLDPETAGFLGDVLAGLKHEMSLLIAENDPYLMLKVADRLVVLSDGKIAADGPPASVINRSTEAFLDLPGWTKCVKLSSDEGLIPPGDETNPYELDYRRALRELGRIR